jgi:Domain of unknown function (DUF1905)/Bacteriocin-protection, YdeI or OmpD-Associated
MTTSPHAGRQLSFEANLEVWADGMDYCAVPVPAHITEALGTKGPVLVMAQVNASRPFAVSLFPVGGGQDYLRIKAQVRRETGTQVGDRIHVRFTVRDRAAVVLPDDLLAALAATGLTAAVKALPPGKQNFTVRRINEAVKPPTRAKRVQEAVAAAHQASQRVT